MQSRPNSWLNIAFYVSIVKKLYLSWYLLTLVNDTCTIDAELECRPYGGETVDTER